MSSSNRIPNHVSARRGGYERKQLGQHLGEGLAATAIIFANVVVGVPLMVLAWYLGRRAPDGCSEKNVNRGTILFSCSVLLNSVWIALGFLPFQWLREGLIGWLSEIPKERGVMLIGFLCLCASIVVDHGRRGRGRLVLRIGQYALALFSALCWIIVLTDM